MCGRYTLATPAEKLAEEFGLVGPLPDLRPSYNVAPTQEVTVVRRAVRDRSGPSRRAPSLSGPRTSGPLTP
ncbi:MAG: SOS response-associated peptidase [Actinobacteria bacterium]|nr:SOS response-associated peptidase [Actinomycetota bacterium]